MVSSNTSSLPEVVGAAGVLIDPDNLEALATALVGLMGNPELRADYRERGIARARRFSWERTAQGTFETFQRALT